MFVKLVFHIVTPMCFLVWCYNCSVLNKNSVNSSNCTKNYKQFNKENIRNCLIIIPENHLQEQYALTINNSDNLINNNNNNTVLDQLTSDNNNDSCVFCALIMLGVNSSKVMDFDLMMDDNAQIKFRRLDNNTVDISLNFSNKSMMERKMKMSMKNILPYLIVPGLLMAGILPWILPGVKILVMFVSMINQMAFTSALFALIRGYIFDTEQEEHIVYINNGYKKKHHKGKR